MSLFCLEEKYPMGADGIKERPLKYPTLEGGL